MKKLFFFFMGIVFLHAQPQLLWQKELSPNARAVGILALNSEDFLVYGTEDIEDSLSQAFLAKITLKGDVLWKKSYEKSFYTAFNSLKETENGFSCLLNLSPSKEHSQAHFLTLDKEGNILTAEILDKKWLYSPSPTQNKKTLYPTIGDKEGEGRSQFQVSCLDERNKLLWVQSYTTDTVYRLSQLCPLYQNGQIHILATQRKAHPDWSKVKEAMKEFPLLIHCDSNGRELSREFLVGAFDVRGIQASRDGNFFIYGSLYNDKEEDSDAVLLKMSPQGDTIWKYIFHALEADGINQIKEQEDGKILASGFTSHSVITEIFRYSFLLLLDSQGNQVWNRLFREGNWVNDALELADKSWLCTGTFLEGFVHTAVSFNEKIKTKAILLALSPNPVIKQVDFSYPYAQNAYTFRADKQDNSWIGGIEFGQNTLFVYAIDSAGNSLARRSAGNWNPSFTTAIALAPTEDNACIVTTNTENMYCFEAQKTRWERDDFNFYNFDVVEKISDNRYALAGSIFDSKLLKRILWIAEMDEKGKFISEKSYNLKERVEIKATLTLADGSRLLTGEVGEIGSEQLILLKINNKGTILWQQIYKDTPKGCGKSIVSLGNGKFALSAVYFDSEEKDLPLLLLVDEQGKELWRRHWQRIQSSLEPVSVVVNQEKERIALICSHANNGYKGEQDIFLVETDFAGNELRKMNLGGAGSFEFGGAVLTQNQELILTGSHQYLRAGDDKSTIFWMKVSLDW